MREFKTAFAEAAEEADGTAVEEQFTEFKLDDRVLRAYKPNPTQLVFLLGAMGRGQSEDQRFGSIMNIIMSALRAEDQDYLESRMLERDPRKRLSLDVLESIFEHLAEEWFGNPTQSPSDSAPSLPSGGTNS